MNTNGIQINTSADFEKMRNAGALTAKILDKLQDIIYPGISTESINDFCHNMIIIS